MSSAGSQNECQQILATSGALPAIWVRIRPFIALINERVLWARAAKKPFTSVPVPPRLARTGSQAGVAPCGSLVLHVLRLGGTSMSYRLPP